MQPGVRPLLAAFALCVACSETVSPARDARAPDVDVAAAPDDAPDVADAPEELAPCDEGRERCGEACVELAADPAHCGACDRACAEGETCAEGACRPACPVGQTACEGECRSLGDDAQNCGACGNGCALGLSCVEGACVLVCPGARTNCGGRCVDTRASNEHCGGCERRCAEGTRCVDGACHGDPCGPDDTPEGRCAGGAVVRCVGGEVAREPCPFGLVCTSSEGAPPACVSPSGARRVTGRVTFQNRPASVGGVGSTRVDPAEGVPVAVVDEADRVLVQGLTDASGRYALVYDAPDGAAVRVRAALARTDSIYNFVVRDYAGATYAFTSPPFEAAAEAERDLDATFEGNAGALSIFTVVRRAFEFLRPFVTGRPAALYVTWQRGRATSMTYSSYFSGASSTMFLNGSDADPDEFDPPVIAHEFGHYVQRWYSRASNPGGPHDGSPADPNLAYGEGGASFLGALITGSRYYIDAGTTRLRIVLDLQGVPLARPYMASASLPIEQPVSEWLVAGAQYAMFRASTDVDGQTRRAMRALTGYLRRTPTPDRGEPGVDLVDYLDGYLCENDGADRATIQSYLVTMRRFPYDFGYAAVCR